MKKTLLTVLVFVVLVSVGYAQSFVPTVTSIGRSTASAQVSCGATATLLRAAVAPTDTTPAGRVSITFQNHGSQAVYIAPRADISTSNAGIVLTQYMSFTTDRTGGDVSWYCITSTSTATVGYTEEK